MSDAIRFKYRAERRGEHVHVTVFAGEAGCTLGNCGELVMRADEWQTFRAMSQCGADMMAPLAEVVIEPESMG